MKSKNMIKINENLIRGMIRDTIKELVRNKLQKEGAKRTQLQIPVRDKLKVDKILKKSGGKIGKNYDIGVGRSGTFILELDRKFEDKVLELLIKNRIQVKEL